MGEIWAIPKTSQKQHLSSPAPAATVGRCCFNAGRDCGAASVAVVSREFLMPPAVNSWI